MWRGEVLGYEKYLIYIFLSQIFQAEILARNQTCEMTENNSLLDLKEVISSSLKTIWCTVSTFDILES